MHLRHLSLATTFCDFCDFCVTITCSASKICEICEICVTFFICVRVLAVPLAADFIAVHFIDQDLRQSHDGLKGNLPAYIVGF